MLVLIILASNAVWALEFSLEKTARKKAQSELTAFSHNKKISAFQKLFVDKVLKSDGDVDFDTRVLLQNSVNDTGDKDVIEAWNSFLRAKTEDEGQARVKDLLSLLSSKLNN